MNRLPARPISLLFLVLLLLAAVSNTALAHNADGSASNFQSHISDYEDEIASMLETTDAIAADYANGDDVNERVDALVATWEEVEFHEAVETHAMALYPPIWIALGGLREAVEAPDQAREVQAWRDRLAAALHEGMGALKLAATQTGSNAATASTQTTEQNDERPTVEVIKMNLSEVASHYRNGDNQSAKSLIHQTYMQRFEGIEGDLIERDADLVSDLEEDFNATLPLLIEKAASPEKVEAQIETMNAKLDRAQTLLDEAAQEQSSVF
jgi:hypothetical protein